MKPKMKLHHDDSPCEELLEEDGLCKKCGYHPDMQSTCFYFYCPKCDVELVKLVCPVCKQEFEKEGYV